MAEQCPPEHIWQVNVQKKGLGASKNIIGLYNLCLTDKTLTLVKIKSNNNVIYDSTIPERVEFSLKNIRSRPQSFRGAGHRRPLRYGLELMSENSIAVSTTSSIQRYYYDDLSWRGAAPANSQPISKTKNGPLRIPYACVRCGDSECFFYMEVGRLTSTGAGELWMHTDDANIAQSMHSTIYHAMSNCTRDETSFPPYRNRSASATEDPRTSSLPPKIQAYCEFKGRGTSTEKGLCMSSCIRQCVCASGTNSIECSGAAIAPMSPRPAAAGTDGVYPVLAMWLYLP
ncbi:Insulin receptor substrate 1 [Eumeta japonica]|uniref:Insulin receptor substrate 1 n=1 Tax=Eumeta variegata TaxID=151549 RepID=A0A4C1UMK1_EUMVA|nr:Insulin receptor substrate 1 [Eumeta japonica]